MRASLKTLLAAGLGFAATAVMLSGQASAQYYERGYDRGDRYERRYDRRDHYERHDRYDNRGGRYDRGPRNPMAGMSLEDQKRAVKNHREAQKKAIKRGYVIP
jgi:hypothetical protein